MRIVRFIHRRLTQDGWRYSWSSFIYFRPKPSKPSVDFEDCKLEASRSFVTEREAKADNGACEAKLGIKA